MTEIQEEEIDLREYINVLLKRKGVIILIFLIAVITATLVSYFVISPVYQSSLIFSVAQIDNRPTVNITESLEIIKRVSVMADSPERAKNIVEKVVEIFIEQNQDIYQGKIKLIKDSLKILKEQVDEFEVNIQEIEETKKKIATSVELSEAERQFQTSLLLSSSVTERELYNNLTNQTNSLKASLESCEDFKVINYAQLPAVPVKPNKKLNILIAGVLGLFVGIFAAFFLEFWQKGK
jgi:capsular polysaccharide biosynthesis protein